MKNARSSAEKLGLYGRIVALVAALPTLLAIYLVLNFLLDFVKNFSPIDFWDFSLLILGMSSYFFIVLIIIDFWQKYFTNFIFRFHLSYIAAYICLVPLFIFIVLTAVGSGVIVAPFFMLMLLGLIMALPEHLKSGFGPRQKIKSDKARKGFIASFFISISIFAIILIITIFSNYWINSQEQSLGQIGGEKSGFYIDKTDPPLNNEIVVIEKTGTQESYDVIDAKEGRKLIFNKITYDIDKNVRKVIYGYVTSDKVKFIKLSNLNITKRIGAKKQYVIQLKTNPPKKLTVELLDKNKETISTWKINTSKTSSDITF